MSEDGNIQRPCAESVQGQIGKIEDKVAKLLKIGKTKMRQEEVIDPPWDNIPQNSAECLYSIPQSLDGTVRNPN